MNIVPGQHGARRSRLSDYGLQLREKQNVRTGRRENMQLAEKETLVDYCMPDDTSRVVSGGGTTRLQDLLKTASRESVLVIGNGPIDASTVRKVKTTKFEPAARLPASEPFGQSRQAQPNLA